MRLLTKEHLSGRGREGGGGGVGGQGARQKQSISVREGNIKKKLTS